tara:strand:- start:54 stop:410 length:357 start_codon:yes stop_codon:yes gene_type:complete
MKKPYITKAWLATPEGKFFLDDIDSRKYSDKEMSSRYGFNTWQIKRVRHARGIFIKGKYKKKETEQVEENKTINDYRVCIELNPEQWEDLRNAAENDCRCVANQAKWYILSSLCTRQV